MLDDITRLYTASLEITDRDFTAMRDIMYERAGVYLKATKKPLIISRLRKRLVSLGLSRFSDYLDILNRPNSPELENFVNAITTNETFFFRHTKQFNILFEELLPEIVKKRQAENKHSISLWSAACSSGEEPYSLAITCHEFFKKNTPMQYKIFASDINTIVVMEAREGLYTDKSFRGVPVSIKEKYFTKIESQDRFKKIFYEINHDIHNAVEFSQHNLLKLFPHRDIDIIFLRNVLIYFDLLSKETVIRNVESALAKGGYLITSLSETLSDIETNLRFTRYGIYQKP